MRDIATEVREFILELPKKSPHILIGVSGGVDSVVLLHILSSLKDNALLEVSVAHIDHGIRDDSTSDKEFVESLATKFKVPFYAKKLTPPISNVEAWGREERYKFFDQIVQDQQIDYIVTAHHKGDLVETFLFRLLTGRMNSLSAPIKGIDLDRGILRPLLAISKEDILEYAKINRISFREDSTNSDQSYKRNFIRYSIVPVLKELEPQSEEHIEEYLSVITEVDTYLKEEAERYVGSNLKEKRELNSVLLERILVLESVKSLGEDARKISINRILDLIKLIKSPSDDMRECDLGFGFSAVVDHEGAKDGRVYFVNVGERGQGAIVKRESEREFLIEFHSGYKGVLLLDPSEALVKEHIERIKSLNGRMVHEASHELELTDLSNLECRGVMLGDRVLIGPERTRQVSKIYKDESWNAEKRWCSILLGKEDEYYLMGSRFFPPCPEVLEGPSLRFHPSRLPVKFIPIKFLSFLSDKV